MIYLGPDDRHPRGLYWGVLGVLVLDFGLALYRAYEFREVDPRTFYYHRLALGTVARVVVPLAVLVAVWFEKPWAAAFFAMTKALSCLQFNASAYGTHLVGKEVSVGLVVAMSAWSLLAAVVSGAYAWYRVREDREDARVVAWRVVRWRRRGRGE